VRLKERLYYSRERLRPFIVVLVLLCNGAVRLV
jgi:hypothetical protein